MSLGAERYRPILTLLVWFLMLELVVVIFSVTSNIIDFGFYITLILMLVTITVIVLIVRAIRREFKEEIDRIRREGLAD